MATKTVVCPECRSPVAPGRYACADCGSLLAAVSLTPSAAASTAAPTPTPNAAPAMAADQSVEVSDRSPDVAPDDARFAASDPVEDDPDVPEMAADEPIAAPAATAPAPAWPPAGDRGPDPLPVPPTRAGSYLPPSAFLDRLALPEPDGSTPLSGRVGRDATTPDRSPRGVDLGRFVSSLDLAADAPRRTIAIGAGLAAVGFLLPWANVLAGAGLLGGYFTQWGLAGPGHWIVVGALGTLAVVALAGGRLARWPVRHAAIAASFLLIGLVWPYLFGVLGRSVGVWTVLAGAIVLAVAGALDHSTRHGPPDPSV